MLCWGGLEHASFEYWELCNATPHKALQNKSPTPVLQQAKGVWNCTPHKETCCISLHISHILFAVVNVCWNEASATW